MPIGSEPAASCEPLVAEQPPEAEFSISLMRRRLGLATLLLVLFLTFMDNTVISVTLADVQMRLHTGISQLQWVINGYALVFASFMLIFGTLGDQFGRKKVMLSGVLFFCGGSVVAALAPNADVLIAGRVIMGLGAAASEPGTPMARVPTMLALGMMLPAASRYMLAVAASGAFSR